MSRYIPSEVQAAALADAYDLRRRAINIGIPAKWYDRCRNLKAAREMVEQVEAALQTVPAQDDPCSMDDWETHCADRDARPEGEHLARMGY